MPQSDHYFYFEDEETEVSEGAWLVSGLARSLGLQHTSCLVKLPFKELFGLELILVFWSDVFFCSKCYLCCLMPPAIQAKTERKLASFCGG